MMDLNERFAEWLANNDNPDEPATPAATVLLLRDGRDGPEVLMVQRNAKGSFASNWVFPGGKVDDEDFGDAQDLVAASRRAASREALEEADVAIDESTLVPVAYWMPPLAAPRRFATWFFVAVSPGGTDADVTIDGGEIVDHVWVRPADALARHALGEVELVPPTWVTLHHLSRFGAAVDAVSAAQETDPFFYFTKLLKGEHMTVVWHGDAAYESGELSTPGERHRLEMAADGWRFAEPAENKRQ